MDKKYELTNIEKNILNVLISQDIKSISKIMRVFCSMYAYENISELNNPNQREIIIAAYCHNIVHSFREIIKCNWAGYTETEKEVIERLSYDYLKDLQL